MSRYIMMQAPREKKENGLRDVVVLNCTTATGKKQAEAFKRQGYVNAGTIESELDVASIMSGISARSAHRLHRAHALLGEIAALAEQLP